MSLAIRSIEFNHDPGDAATSALNIRRSYDDEVLLPEWVSGRSVEPRDSPAAYSIQDTAGRTITIAVGFEHTGAGDATYEIEAGGGGVLGAIPPTLVTIPAGSVTHVVSLPLTSRAPFTAIGLHDVEWTWRARPAGDRDWTTLARSRHRIYLLLAVPSQSWEPAYPRNRNPWTDVLDFACVVAAGAADEGSATAAVVRAVNSDYHLEYDVESGAPNYLIGQFDLTRWVDRVLRGRRTDQPFMPGCATERYWEDWIVNCADCGGAVALMSTILGTRAQYTEQTPFGFLNLVEPIGRGPTNNPFYGCHGPHVVGPGQPRRSFSFHAFARVAGGNYDACLRVSVPLFLRIALWLAWLIVIVLTLGRVRIPALRSRAEGWLIGVVQHEFEQLVISPGPAAYPPPLPGPPKSRRVLFR